MKGERVEETDTKPSPFAEALVLVWSFPMSGFGTSRVAADTNIIQR
jgi:hypothetical protein